MKQFLLFLCLIFFCCCQSTYYTDKKYLIKHEIYKQRFKRDIEKNIKNTKEAVVGDYWVILHIKDKDGDKFLLLLFNSLNSELGKLVFIPLTEEQYYEIRRQTTNLKDKRKFFYQNSDKSYITMKK